MSLNKIDIQSKALMLAQVGAWEYNVAEGIISLTDIAKAIHGISINDTPSFDELILVYKEGESRNALSRHLKRAIEYGETYDLQLQIQPKQGESVWVRAIGEPILDDGNCTSLVGTFQNITEEVELDKKLEDNQRTLLIAQKVAKIGSFEFDLLTGNLFWSDEVYAIWGLDKKEIKLTYEMYINTIHPDDREIVETAYNYSVKNKTPFSVKHKLVMADDSIKHVHCRSVTYYNNSDKPVKTIGTAQDITEQENLRIELLKSEKRYKDVSNYYLEGLIFHRQGIVVEANKACEDIYGYASDELIGMNTLSVLAHPDDIDEIVKMYTSLNEPSAPYECRILTKEGKVKWVENRSNEVEFDGKLTTVTRVRDISDIKKTREEAKKNERILNIISENTSDHIMLVNKDRRIQYINYTVEGMTPEQVVGVSVVDFAPENDKELVKSKYDELFKTKQIVRYSQSFVSPDNDTYYFDVRLDPVLKNEEVDSVVVNARDVTDTRRTQEKLLQSEERLNIITSNTSDSIMLVDKNQNIVFLNKDAYGIEVNNVIGKSLLDFAPEGYRDVADESFKSVFKNGREANYQTPFIAPNGDVFYFDVRMAPVFKDNSVDSVVISARDVTSRKQVESDLIESEERLSLITENSSDYIIWVNENLIINFINRTPEHNREAVIGHSILEFLPGPSKSTLENACNTVYDTGDVESVQLDYIGIDDSGYVFDVNISPVIREEKVVSLVITARDVTRKLAVSKSLKEEQEKYKKLVDLSPDPIVITQMGAYKFVNNAFCKLLGYTEEEVLAKDFTIFNVIPKEDHTLIMENYQKFAKMVASGEINNKDPRKGVYNMINRGGTIINCESTTLSIDYQGTSAEMTIIRDVTERNLREANVTLMAKKSVEYKDALLSLTNNQFTNLSEMFNNITKLVGKVMNLERVSIWKFNNNQSSIYCESLYTQSTNIVENGFELNKQDYPNYFSAITSNKAIIADDVLNNEHAKELLDSYLKPLGITSMMDMIIRGGDEEYGVLCLEHVGDRKVWIESEQEFAASIANVVSLTISTSVQKEAEAFLRESEKRYKDLSNLSIEAIFIHKNGMIMDVNNACSAIFGYTYEEFMELDGLKSLVHPDDMAATNEKIKTKYKGSYEIKMIRKDGSVIDCEIQAKNILFKGEECRVTRVRNITERKQSEKALRDSEEKYRQLVDLSPNPIVITQEGKYRFVNKAFVDMFGYSQEELFADDFTFFNILDEREIPKVQNRYKDWLSGKPLSPHYTLNLVTKSGEVLTCDTTSGKITFNNEHADMAIIHDITERKRMEEELLLKKQEVISQRIKHFIGGQEQERKRVARELHDSIGQSLTSVKMMVDDLKLEYNDIKQQVLKANVNGLIEEVKQISESLAPSVLTDLGFEKAVQQLCKKINESTKINVELFVDVKDEIMDLYALDVYRIIQESLNNAVKHSTAKDIQVQILLIENSIRIFIEDNGIGFDVKKEFNKGTKGLSNLKERTESLGGVLFIDTSPGNGTTINIEIPIN